MRGADIYVGWKNSTNGVTLANLIGTGHSRPSPNSVQSATLQSSLLGSKPSWSALSFSFCRPSATTPLISSSQKYIYASSSSGPSSNLNSLSASFPGHDSYSSFTFDFSKTSTTNSGTGSSGSSSGRPILETSESFTYETITGIHGALMWIAWSVSPFLGISIARYGKNSLGPMWFTLHKIFMGGVTLTLTLGSFILIFLYHSPKHFYSTDTMNNAHVKMGLAITVGCMVNVVLGWLSDRWFDPSRKSIPMIDKVWGFRVDARFIGGWVEVCFC